MGWRITLWAVIVLAALFFLYQVRSILPPFVLAILISVLLDPTIRKLTAKGVSRSRAVWSVFVLFFGMLTLLSVVLAPVVSSQVGNLRDRLEDASNQIASEGAARNFFLRWNPRYQNPSGLAAQIDSFLEGQKGTLERFGLPTTTNAMVDRYVEPHKQEITNAVQTFFNSLLGIVSSLGSQILLLLFTPIFVLLILLDLDRLKRRGASWIPPSIRSETLTLAQQIGDVFVRYLRGITLVLVYYVGVAGILLTLLGAPYAFLLAILFALIYLVPYVGPVLNACLLVLLTAMSGREANWFFSLGSPIAFAAVIAVVYFLLMFLFDQLVYTRVVGDSVGLHPVVSFFVVFSGAALFGAVGMILAFPVAGSLKVVLDRLIRITSDAGEGLQLPAVPLRHRVST